MSCLSGASRARRLRIRLWRNNKLSRQASKLRSRELSSSFFLSVFGRAAKGRHHYYRKTNRLEPLQQQRPTAITYWKVEDFLKVYRSTVHYSDYEFCQETWCAMRRVPWGLIALKGSAFYQSNIYKNLLCLRCIFYISLDIFKVLNDCEVCGIIHFPSSFFLYCRLTGFQGWMKHAGVNGNDGLRSIFN